MSILGSSANCNQGSQNANALTNKYCGSVLNPTKDAIVNVPICGKILEGTTESSTYFGLCRSDTNTKAQIGLYFRADSVTDTETRIQLPFFSIIKGPTKINFLPNTKYL